MPRMLKATGFALLIGVGGVAASLLPFLQRLEENLGLAMLFKLRGPREAPAEVVIISIDRDSADKLGLSGSPSRWPRTVHARLVEKLAREGARVVIFDLYFTEPRSPQDDRLFAGALEKAGNVVLAEPLRAHDVSLPSSPANWVNHRIVRTVKPMPVLAEAAAASAPFVLPRYPLRVNRYWTFQPSAGDQPTFPVVAFHLHALAVHPEFVRLLKIASSDPLERPATAEESAIRMREIKAVWEANPEITTRMIEELERSAIRAEEPAKYRLLRSLIQLYGGPSQPYLNFYGPPRTISTLPYHKALSVEAESTGGSSLGVRGKAVFVGLSEVLLTEKEDSFYTVFSSPDGVFLSGVEIAATAFANLLEDSHVKRLAEREEFALLLVWGLFLGLVYRGMRLWCGILAAAGLCVAYVYVAKWQFTERALWYPIVIPLFLQNAAGAVGTTLWSYFEIRKERQNVRKALGFYVPAEVVHQLAHDILDLKRGDQTSYGICLLTDASGYSSVSEAMPSDELGDYMQQYLDAAFEPIKQHGGVIVDLKGDSILALWRGERGDLESRRRACHAALSVARAVRRFNSCHDRFKLPMRLGMHAGEVFLGNVGSAGHYNYGVRGDAVNVASRLEGLNKHIGTELLASHEVVHGIDGLLTREAGCFQLKGKSQPVVVHELTCLMQEATERQIRTFALFAEALALFRQRRWDEAYKTFQLLAREENDRIASFYTRLCEEFQKQPPPEPWSGIVAMDDK